MVTEKAKEMFAASLAENTSEETFEYLLCMQSGQKTTLQILFGVRMDVNCHAGFFSVRLYSEFSSVFALPTVYELSPNTSPESLIGAVALVLTLDNVMMIAKAHAEAMKNYVEIVGPKILGDDVDN